MVSLWPWKGDDKSAASFEKTLSALSARISKDATQLDQLRLRSRRLKALWTLYTSFVYILYTLILALVVGWRNWGVTESAAVAGGPVIIWVARFLLSSYYGYRIDRTQERLDGLQKQKDVTIDKLKEATKYNSTQQLLEKYGSPSTPNQMSPGSAQKSSDRKKKKNVDGTVQSIGNTGRTGMPPPPTANIPRNDLTIPSAPATPQPLPPSARNSPFNMALMQPGSARNNPLGVVELEPPGFAPNAFPDAPQYAPSLGHESKWYDRIMDLLLGDDETLAKNRLALICQNCRLVNGQAPPGIKRVEDVGRWRCQACNSWNGEENEAVSIVKQAAREAKAAEESSPVDSEDLAIAEETLETVELSPEDSPKVEAPEEIIESKAKPGPRRRKLHEKNDGS